MLVRKEREEGIVASAVSLLLHVLIESVQTSWPYQLSSGHVVVWRETPFSSFLSLFPILDPAWGREGIFLHSISQLHTIVSGWLSLSSLPPVLESCPDGKGRTLDVVRSRWYLSYSCLHKATFSRLFTLFTLLMLLKTSFFNRRISTCLLIHWAPWHSPRWLVVIKAWKRSSSGVLWVCSALVWTKGFCGLTVQVSAGNLW